jgi:hypothetical protein
LDAIFSGSLLSHDEEPGPPMGWNDQATLARITWLFSHSASLLAPYTEKQVNEGLWWIIGEGQSEYLFALTGDTTPWPERLACVRSITALFAGVFARRCEAALSHLDEPGNPLNQVCYMWWDIFQLGPPYVPPELHEAIIGVMGAILDIDHDAVIESALHGLGHWSEGHEREVKGIIDGCLKRHRQRGQRPLRPELRSYAEGAREGLVL